MYLLFSPAPPLRDYIDCYWVLRSHSGDAAQLAETIFVDGRADILFNFGAPYQRFRTEGDPLAQRLGISNLDGQRQHPVAIVQQGSIDLIGVRFQPGGLSGFLKIPMFELSNQVLPLDEAITRGLRDFEAQLADLGGQTTRQIALLDDYFRKALREPAPQVALVRMALRQIERSGGSVDIARLSRELGYSIRSLDRLFQQYVGLAPKFYARIARFQHAMRLLADTSVRLSEIAFRCGYYDQAHFAKEFKAFTGQTAEVFRASLFGKTAPNLVQFLQDPTAAHG